MVNDASIKPHDTLPNEYILKRLLPIHPKKALNERTPITIIAKENRPLEINNTYLVLKFILIEDEAGI
jgi:hypothetical protein